MGPFIHHLTDTLGEPVDLAAWRPGLEVGLPVGTLALRARWQGGCMDLPRFISQGTHSVPMGRY